MFIKKFHQFGGFGNSSFTYVILQAAWISSWKIRAGCTSWVSMFRVRSKYSKLNSWWFHVVTILAQCVPLPGHCQTVSQVGVVNSPLEFSLNPERIAVNFCLITRPPVKIFHYNVDTCHCFACVYKFLDWTPCCTIGIQVLWPQFSIRHRIALSNKYASLDFKGFVSQAKFGELGNYRRMQDGGAPLLVPTL
jgi:hypothetical protein